MFFSRFVLLAAAFAVTLATACAATAKKLIEFGWDEPSPPFMRQHIAEMEKTPFDGCVFHVDIAKPDGGGGSFTWEVWGSHTFAMADLQKALNDLKATHFNRFKHNFLRFNTTPGKIDWFDDFSAIVANARSAARIAREGKCAGILLDTEQYEGQLFNYLKQRDVGKKSWADYAAQTRLRGHEVMQAFQQGYPDLTIFLTFAYSLPWMQCSGDVNKLPDTDYGLLAPFLDGMFAAAKGKTKVVDGYESSYGYKQPAQFETAYETIRHKLLPIVAEPNAYQKHLSVGFGVWMDQDWRKHGWNTNDFSMNYFTPAAFASSVSAALRRSDEYVWIYTEKPLWWSRTGGSQDLPSAYDAAVRNAKNSSK